MLRHLPIPAQEFRCAARRCIITTIKDLETSNSPLRKFLCLGIECRTLFACSRLSAQGPMRAPAVLEAQGKRRLTAGLWSHFTRGNVEFPLPDFQINNFIDAVVVLEPSSVLSMDIVRTCKSNSPRMSRELIERSNTILESRKLMSPAEEATRRPCSAR